MKSFLFVIFFASYFSSFAQSLIDSIEGSWSFAIRTYDSWSGEEWWSTSYIYHDWNRFEFDSESYTVLGEYDSLLLIREENNKIMARMIDPWGIPLDTVDSDFLLYNFNSLEIGDTIYYDYLAYTDSTLFTPVLVAEVDSILIDTLYFRYYYCNNSDEVIHKIGSIENYFKPIRTTYPTNSYLCSFFGRHVNLDSTIIDTYYHSGNNYCFLGNEDNKSFTSIYPNPTSGLLYLETNMDGQEAAVYDLQGNLILFSNIENNLIDLTSFPNGIYILKLQNEAGYKLHKIVKD